MHDLQQKQFEELRAKAIAELRNEAACSSYRRLFTLIVLPSFSPSWRMTLHAPWEYVKNKNAAIDVCIWRSDKDWEKISQPVSGLPVLRLKPPEKLKPTLEVKNGSIQANTVNTITQRLNQIQISPFLQPTKFAGADGTSFEFVYEDFMHGIKIRWWENHPKEWQILTQTIRKIANEAFLEAKIELSV